MADRIDRPPSRLPPALLQITAIAVTAKLLTAPIFRVCLASLILSPLAPGRGYELYFDHGRHPEAHAVITYPFDLRPHNAYDQSQTEILSLKNDRISPSSPLHICKRRYLLRSNRS
jgi:hypothetical protein